MPSADTAAATAAHTAAATPAATPADAPGDAPGDAAADAAADAASGTASDAELIAAVRSGDLEAYGVLYRRHAGPARTQARRLVGSSPDAEDLVAEAFAKMLDVLLGGGGPDTAFRAYLLTTVRNTLRDRARRDRRLEWTDDPAQYERGEPWEDPAVAALEATLAARAFHRLPERWQVVLWHTEVERAPRPQVASLLGLTPNGVAALAYRARERLRQAYLQEQVAGGTGREHRAAVDRLGTWVRGGLADRHRAGVEAHLAGCPGCRALARELADVNGALAREPGGRREARDAA